MTQTELATWHAALGSFPAKIVNASVLEIALSETRFPELGDLYRLCRRRAIAAGLLQIPYSPHGSGEESDRPTNSELADVAERLGLDV